MLDLTKGVIITVSKFDAKITPLITQIKALSETCNNQIDMCEACIAIGTKCKSTYRLIYDTAISFKQQGDMYHEIENDAKATEYYNYSLNLFESLLPIYDTNSNILCEHIDLLRQTFFNIGDASRHLR